jgi:hypothetical protein
MGETANGRNGEWASGRVGEWAMERVGAMERSTVEDGLPRRRLCGGGRTIFAGALVGFAEEDAAGAGGAGEDAFSGRFVLEIGVGRDAADGDL